MTPPIVKRYSIAFDKYKWVGLASLVLVVAGSTVVAMQPDPPPSYVANGALTQTRPPVTFSVTGTEIQQAGQSLTQEVLLQDQILETVAAKVNLKPKQLIENIVLKVPTAEAPAKPDGAFAPQVIDIRFKDSDPKRAKTVVEELMLAMIKLSGEINTSRLKSIIKKVNERIPQAKSELVAAEKKLEQFDRVERPAILAAENGSLLTAITTTQAQQRQLQLTLSGIDAQIVSLQQRLGLSPDQAYFSSALSADPIIANLRAQIYQTESQIEVLRRDLRPEHPTMVQLQRQRDASLTLLQQRAAEVVSGGGAAARLRGQINNIRSQSNLDPARQQWANQLVALETQRETLRKQLVDEAQSEAKLRREYSLIPNKQLERSRLEQEVGLKKAVYDKMQTKLTDSEVAESETVSSLAIARETVVIADKKVPKNVPMTLGIGGLLGLVVGGGVIFLLGSLEGTFKTKEDIRESLKQREVANLGELPLMPTYDLTSYEVPVLFSPDSVYLEFYEKFRSNLRRIGGKDLKVLLVTSTTSSEGKTVSAYNLGIACARAGKRTLIIELDLRSPSHASSLRVTPDPDAIVEPLRYYGNLSECVRLVPDVENLYIVPSPGPVRQSAAVIESSELRRLLEDARQRFDFVILDTCALSLSNDPLLIQPYSDGILLVARPNYTQENMLGEAIDQLTEAELGLVGVIINGAEDVIISAPKSTVKSPADSIEESPETTAVMRN
jgi:capsular exopolysaccharide synthesis family protein